ncbi:hypothetical protein T439DRAFT_329108 [Meredithblackwellia eburnea MCA 4105]
MAANQPKEKLAFGKFSAWIRVNGIRAPIYGVDATTRVTKGYIESVEGARFTLCLKDNQHRPDLGTRGDFYIDGKRQWTFAKGPESSLFRKAPDHRFRLQELPGKPAPTPENPNNILPFRFGSVKLTDDDDALNSLNDEVGTIKICIRRVKKVKDTDLIPEMGELGGEIHETVGKGSLSHQVELGDARSGPSSISTQTRTVDARTVDPKDDPFHIFEFRYISRALLEIKHLIPTGQSSANSRNRSESPGDSDVEIIEDESVHQPASQPQASHPQPLAPVASGSGTTIVDPAAASRDPRRRPPQLQQGSAQMDRQGSRSDPARLPSGSSSAPQPQPQPQIQARQVSEESADVDAAPSLHHPPSHRSGKGMTDTPPPGNGDGLSVSPPVETRLELNIKDKEPKIKGKGKEREHSEVRREMDEEEEIIAMMKKVKKEKLSGADEGDDSGDGGEDRDKTLDQRIRELEARERIAEQKVREKEREKERKRKRKREVKLEVLEGNEKLEKEALRKRIKMEALEID